MCTAAEVARQLRCSRWTVYEYLRSGSLPGQKIGRRWLIKQRDVETLKASGFVVLNAPPPSLVNELAEQLVAQINKFLWTHRDGTWDDVREALTQVQDALKEHD
jgi:excisionase family DNA binding protein